MLNSIKKIVFICFITTFFINISVSYGYSDLIKEHWAYECVNNLSEKLIFSGYPDETFKPDKNMTRAEFITILVKTVFGNADVSSVTEYWADNYINIAIENNILKLSDYYEFNSDEDITRLEIVKMMVRALGDFEYKNIDVEGFLDFDKYSEDIKRDLSVLYEANILNGYPDKTFKLANTATRAEVACIISNFIKNKDNIISSIKNELMLYEDDIAVINKEKLPYDLKKLKYSKDLSYVTTKINDIKCFKFGVDVPEKYKDIFYGLYNSEDLYSKYRVKFGEGNFVIAIDIKTINNTNDYEVFSGYEFLHIDIFDEDINLLDVFDSDEVIRQTNLDASSGERINPSESRDTSVFYIVDALPCNKIRIDRNITELYNVKLKENEKVSSFNSLIIKFKEGEE